MNIGSNDVKDSPIKSEPTSGTPEKKEKKHHHHHSKHHRHHKHKHHTERRQGPAELTNQSPVESPSKSPGVLGNVTDSPQKTYILSRDEFTNTIRISSSKKRIVNNCGVQVNLRRRTENKYVQVNLSRRHDTSGVQTPEKVSVNGHSIKHSVITGSRVSRGVQTVQTAESTAKTPKPTEIVPKKENTAKTPKPTENVSKTESTTKTPKPTDRQQHSEKGSERKEESIDTEKLIDSKFVPYDKHLSSTCVDNPLVKSKFKHLMHLEQYPNGGALVLHVYQSEISKLSPEEMEEFVRDYFDFVYGESSEGVAHCVMGIVHDAITDMPDFIDYFAEKHPEITVKAGVLGKSDIETMTMTKYQEQMVKSYMNGTFRCGPLLQISLVGTVHEEVGGFFPAFLDVLEANPFLKVVMPWGSRSVVPDMPRNRSNDGPILWARPGEQMVPTADLPKSPYKRKR